MQKKTIVIVSYTSWYHLLGVFSYLTKNNIKPDFSILVVNSFFDKTRVFDSEILSRYLGNYVLNYTYSDIAAHVDKLTDDIDIYVISTSDTPYRLTLPLRRKSYKYKMVVVEEGIGSYSTRIKNVFSHYRESKKSGVLGWFYFAKVFILMVIKFFMFIKVPRVYWYNFDRAGLRVNKDVVDSYKSILKEMRFCRKKIPLFERSDRVSMLIGAPLCELGLIDDATYIDKLESVFKDYNRVYVKPHPIEDLRKYSKAGFELMAEGGPFELVYGDEMEDVDIYTFTSTCCYTSRLFFDKKILRLSEFDPLYSGLTKAQRAIIDWVSS